MNLQTVEIPRDNARAEAASYARAARHESDPRRRAELERMAHAYRTVAATTNIGLIALTPTIKAGGVTMRTRTVRWYSHSDRAMRERAEHYLLPKLAVSRWQAAFCYSGGVQSDGSVELTDSLNRRAGYRSGVIELATGFAFPESGFTAGWSGVATRTAGWRAMVPIVPPRLRPARGMGDRLVLWEVDSWEWEATPAPPGDPALLRHVAGDIYAVEAVWDLTPLERLVLSERRPA